MTRNYAAEYVRRVANNTARGLSISQARGHARGAKGERPISALRSAGIVPPRTEKTDEKIYSRAVPALERGASIKQAAKEAGVSEGTLRRFGDRHGVFEAEAHRTLKSGKSVPSRLRFSPPTFHVPEKGGDIHLDVEMGSYNASVMGKYWNAVHSALDGDTGALRALNGRTVQDIHGARYTLETDPARLRAALDQFNTQQRTEFYQTLYRRRGKRAA